MKSWLKRLKNFRTRPPGSLIWSLASKAFEGLRAFRKVFTGKTLDLEQQTCQGPGLLVISTRMPGLFLVTLMQNVSHRPEPGFSSPSHSTARYVHEQHLRRTEMQLERTKLSPSAMLAA